jgi:two-component sensor histidine kinase
MEWRESGGPPVTGPLRRGYGTRLINGGVGHELGGTVHLDFDVTGLRCTLDVPLDAQDRFTSFRQENGIPLSAA